MQENRVMEAVFRCVFGENIVSDYNVMLASVGVNSPRPVTV